MDFHDALAVVKSHDVFAESDDAYLAHGFISFSHGDNPMWQIGFYDPKTDKISSYTVEGRHVTRAEPSDVFKEKSSVPKLDTDAVSLPYTEAVRLAHERLRQVHPQHPLMKTIMILQTIDSVAQFNFTLVTQTLHMYNVRLDAQTGEVLRESLESLMSLRADQ